MNQSNVNWEKMLNDKFQAFKDSFSFKINKKTGWLSAYINGVAVAKFIHHGDCSKWHTAILNDKYASLKAKLSE